MWKTNYNTKYSCRLCFKNQKLIKYGMPSEVLGSIKWQNLWTKISWYPSDKCVSSWLGINWKIQFCLKRCKIKTEIGIQNWFDWLIVKWKKKSISDTTMALTEAVHLYILIIISKTWSIIKQLIKNLTMYTLKDKD